MSTNEQNLGRLEPVDELRRVWPNEANDFTPWLAKEENLALLSDTIGIDLELEAQEKDVGPFRADILCKGTASNDWVLVENQLERTDHTHLGQLLTYAAGLKAVTIVWIADRFTEEHRAALDWLNEITDERFNFFGLEIELWRIGESPVAPKFNIACKPNDWANTVRDVAERKISETQLLQQEYWQALRDILIERKSVVRPRKPLPQCWTGFAVGSANFEMSASVNTQKPWIQISMGCYGPDAKPHFYLLKQDKEAIEREIGESLDWDESPNKKECRIALCKLEVDPLNRDDWKCQHEWMVEKLEAFHGTFSSRVKRLNAEEAPDEDTK